jgi:hypothetical protein
MNTLRSLIFIFGISLSPIIADRQLLRYAMV